MDWSKAKNILIAALLITNLMLGLAIYNNTDSPGIGDQEALKQNTILLLKEHGIFVEEDLISERNERLPVMSVRYRSISRDKADAAIADSAVQLSPTASAEEYRHAAEAVLEAAGIFSENCVFESVEVEDNGTVVYFGTEYEGYILDNAKNYVTFRNGEAQECSVSWAEPVSMGQNKKRVLPAHEALIRFMTLLEEERQETEVTREEIHVDQIRLVYWLEGYTENGGVSEDTAVPYWCIRYNDGASVHIAAYEE